MEFEDTGLLNTQQVFKAYGIYKQMADELEQGTRGLSVAQQLMAAGCRDEKAIIVALLSDMPGYSIKVISERLGAWYGRLIGEMDLARQVGYEGAEHLSDEMKLFLLADHIVLVKQLKHLAQVPPHFNAFFNQVKGSTPSRKLEKLYEETLAALKDKQPETGGGSWFERLFGTDPDHPALEDDEDYIPSHVEYAPFDSLELGDDPVVHAAYQIITQDPRTSSESFYIAACTASVLHDLMVYENPAVIAAAFINAAIGEEASEGEIEAWRDAIGDEAADILMAGNLHSADYERSVHEWSEGLAQSILGYSIARVEIINSKAHDVMDLAHNGTGLDQQLLMSEMLTNCRDVKEIWNRAAPALSRAGAPELEAELKTCVRETMDFLVNSMPKKNKQPPKPQQ